jgi:hypothetical protein
MINRLNKATSLSIILLATLLTVAISQSTTIVAAQTDVATVIVMPTNGGTTDPAPGQYTYANGTTITIKAIPDSGYTFSYWLISGDLFPGHTTSQAIPSTIIDPDTGQTIQSFPTVPRNTAIDTLTFTANPANITCGYGYSYTYTAIFTAINAPNPTPGSTDAVVIVMPTNGGNVNPQAGMYNYPNGTAIVLSATPNSGYQFSYWLISGGLTAGHPSGAPSQVVNPDTGEVAVVPRPAEPQSATGVDSLTFTANPTRITCGYGYTYTYTAVFSKVSDTSTPTASPTQIATASPNPTATPTSGSGTDWTTWIIVIVVVVVIIIVLVTAVLLRKKN